MISADVTFGEPSASASKISDFSTPPQVREPMNKGYDYLAAPLTALRAGNTRLAIQQLEELAVVKPELVEVQYHLARAYQAAGDEPRARALLAEVADTGDHPFRAHATAQLVKLGGPPAETANPGVVPPGAGRNTGIVPPHVAEVSNAAVAPEAPEAPVEAASQVAAEAVAAEEIAGEAQQAEPVVEEPPAAEEPAAEALSDEGAADEAEAGDAGGDDASQATPSGKGKGRGKKGKGA